MPVNDLIKLTVVTPYRELVNVKCNLVELNTEDGINGVMYGHTPVIMAIIPGLLRYRVADTYYNAFLSVGYATVHKDEVTVICNAAEWPNEIDVSRAKASYERNRLKFNDSKSSKTVKSHAKHAMRRAKARIHVAEQYGDKPAE